MRILHCLPGIAREKAVVGFEVAVYYLTKELATLGHEVAILSAHRQQAEPVPGVRSEAYELGLTPFLLSNPFFRAITDFQPDVVHIHHAYSLTMTLVERWLQRKRLPYVVTLHGSLSNGSQTALKAWYDRLIQRHDLRHAGFLHIVAEWERADVAQLATRSVLITSGFDLSCIPRDVDRDYLRRNWPALGGNRIFLYLGRLNCQAKGVDLLLNGFAKAKLRNARLVLTGPFTKSSDEHEIRGLIRRLSLEDRVLLPGPIVGPAKYHVYASADVFVQTSRAEGSPLTVLEAAASGLPCMTTPAASLDGDISHHGAGLQVNATETDIARGFILCSSMADSELRQMGQRGRELVAAHHSWTEKAQCLVDAYKGLLSRS